MMKKGKKADKTLTLKCPDKEIVISQFGVLTYHDWCVMECARLFINGETRRVYSENGLCWID